MLIKNASAVLKDAWKHRHRVRAIIPWCGMKNIPVGEAEEVEEAEALTT